MLQIGVVRSKSTIATATAQLRQKTGIVNSTTMLRALLKRDRKDGNY